MLLRGRVSRHGERGVGGIARFTGRFGQRTGSDAPFQRRSIVGGDTSFFLSVRATSPESVEPQGRRTGLDQSGGSRTRALVDCLSPLCPASGQVAGYLVSTRTSLASRDRAAGRCPVTSVRIPQALRRLVRERVNSRCEYCQTSEWLCGLPCEIDHIIPRSKERPTTDDNLCLACASCNGYKRVSTHATDPDSGEDVSLFNPRQQRWNDHFAWNKDGTTIIGLTACG